MFLNAITRVVLISALLICIHRTSISQTCANPLVIDSPVMTGSTEGVENDNALSGTPTCVTSVGTAGQIWYYFSSAFEGVFSINTNGSSFDTKLHVYTGSCGSLQCVAGDDDSGGSLTSALSFNAAADVSYLIRVGGYNANVGAYILNIAFDGACVNVEPNSISAILSATQEVGCYPSSLMCNVSPFSNGWSYQWFESGFPIDGATSQLFVAQPSSSEALNYTCVVSCPGTNISSTSNELTITPCYSDLSSSLNYLLVQNVTTTGNIPGQSIQVQFDLNWGNTWRDDINWDAVWVFMKYKDANGVWKHAKVSPTGYSNGQGTPNLIEPTTDQMGAFVRLALEGQGNFSSEGMQLRWNYSADGLASVSGLEVRVFAIEMVYHPQGDFSMSMGAAAPGNKIPVINSRLSPVLSADGDASVRIKGNSGIDLDANGSVENTTYPTGYYPFYMFKYEMSEQQYADFLNCLTPTQRTTLGVAGSTITQTGGQYFAAMPNRACVLSNNVDTTVTVPRRIFAYADWAGLRPMSYLEFQKSFNGPLSPNANGGPCVISDASGNWGSGVYGVKGLAGNVSEPYVRISSSVFNRTTHGNGVLAISGLSDTSNWVVSEIGWMAPSCSSGSGLRLCRTAE
jgi:hypothetical protein